MEIKKGDKFKCIENVKMGDTEEVVYTEGKQYLSESDDCITNDLGEKRHSWSWNVGDDYTDHPELYFKKISEPDEKPLTPYEIRTAVLVYKTKTLPNHTSKEDIAKEIHKIARLLRDGE
jgi:hypothetical protein